MMTKPIPIDADTTLTPRDLFNLRRERFSVRVTRPMRNQFIKTLGLSSHYIRPYERGDYLWHGRVWDIHLWWITVSVYLNRRAIIIHEV